MATLADGIYSKLTGDATVAGLVGTRVYPAPIPQEQPVPAIAYLQISRAESYSHSGPSGLVTKRVQVTAHADTWPESRALADAIRGALAGRWRSWGPVNVRSARLVNELERFVDAFERPVVILDFMVTYKEAD